MERFYPILAIFLLTGPAGSMTACAVKPSVRVHAPAPAVDALDRLHSDLDRIFSDPNFVSAQWGVEIISLDRGEMLFERNSTSLYMPASNNKLLTSAAALVRLGPDYRFETRVLADGEINGGALKGNLVIVGSGDPCNAARFRSGEPFQVFREWASRLKEIGVRKIEGDIIGDGRAFREPSIGKGWEWDDLAYGYAAPVTALQFNENLVSLEIKPGETEGSPATVKASPLANYLNVDVRVLTGAVGSEASIEMERNETGESVVMRGTVPLKSDSVTRTVAVRYPILFYLQALKEVLQNEGIEVSNCAIRSAEGSKTPTTSLRLLWTHSSLTLTEILKPLLKVSQNLYAETLTRALGFAVGGEGSFARGKEIVEETLRAMAIEKGTYSYADGSGLSRLNLISADLLVRIFKFMYRHRHSSHFYDSLPVAGVDGTIASRMKGTRAENNVHAKTGTIANVRSLSGYIRTADGEMLAFAMIANNFLVSSKAAEFVQDSALERLANFTRK